MIRNWKKVLREVAHVVEERVDRMKGKVEVSRSRQTMVMPYMGYGSRTAFHLTGRVLKDKGIRPPRETDGMRHNLWQMYKRFESDEVRGARVSASYRGTYVETVSNAEGYVHLAFQPEDHVQPNGNMAEVHLALTENPQNTAVTGQVLIPSPDASFAVISDIDDTIMRTNATDLLEMVRNTLLKNARTRLPFEGVADFYRALMRGVAGRPVNPIFYVSNSPWNLYDFLVDFMALNHIPTGPVLLRDFGLDEHKVLTDGTHKYRQIADILATYPHLNVLLVGDSGERDPEIYHQIAMRYPDRVLAVYIRDVTDESGKDDRVHAFAKDLALKGISMLLVKDTAQAEAHARAQGWLV